MDLEYFDYNSGISESSFFSYVEERNLKYKLSDKVPFEKDTSLLEINELLKRYSFIYENTGIILGQLIYESSSKNLSISKRLSSNTNIYINDGNIGLDDEFDLFCSLEEFLLGDIPIEDTSFYDVINRIKDNDDLFKCTKKQFVNEDVIDFNMRVILEFVSFFIEQQVGSYILNKNIDKYEKVYDDSGYVKCISITDVKQKLKALRPYFDILFYKNKMYGMWDGKRRIWIDRRDEFRVDSTKVYYNSFNMCFCDCRHQENSLLGEYYENTFRLPEQAIQSVYCRYHSELPWNMQIVCSSDSFFERPNGTSCCGKEFSVKESELFVVNNNAYQLCSNCGYIVKVDVDDKILSRIKRNCNEDDNYLRKKLLLSELINIDKEGTVKSLVKKRDN